MIIAAWVLLGALGYCAQGLPPPVVTALQPGDNQQDINSHEESLAVPDKRILKYLLPSTQAWAGRGVNALIPTGQEGNKRGYVDRNFLRFGRTDAEKRYAGKNFLRFGRGGSDDYTNDEDDTSLSSAEKRDRNFLRFGRDSGRNFLRFGRPDLEQFGFERSPLAFAKGLQQEDQPTEEEKRAGGLRYGNKNFLRFGRNYNKNFIRFGRSVDSQTYCDDCEEDNLNQHSTATSPSSPPSSPSSSSSPMQAARDLTGLTASSATGGVRGGARRSKRSAPVYYDYTVLPSHSPASWARDFQPVEDEDFEEPDLESLQDLNKRSSSSYNRNFLRFGRDRNFLRFGKREASDNMSPPSGAASVVSLVAPVQYPRLIRAPIRNFLRFG